MLAIRRGYRELSPAPRCEGLLIRTCSEPDRDKVEPNVGWLGGLALGRSTGLGWRALIMPSYRLSFGTSNWQVREGKPASAVTTWIVPAAPELPDHNGILESANKDHWFSTFGTGRTVDASEVERETVAHQWIAGTDF